MDYKRYLFVLLLILLIIIPYSFAIGICELDKQKYHPSETASFTGVCTSPQEENRIGFIVFRNSTGHILQSNLASSGSCRTSVFGDNFLFPSTANYTGNATFSLNADGTGSPLNWGDSDDITTDDFNVSGANIGDCIIKFEIPVNVTPVFDLGREASLSIDLFDAITESPLVGASCTLHIESLNDAHIFSVPYEKTGFPNGLKTTATGEVAFEKLLDISLLEVDTNYLIRAYCWCSPNGTDQQCYIGNNGLPGGEVAGFKSCVTTTIAGTTSNDFRQTFPGNNFIATTLIYFILMGVYFFLGRLNQKNIKMDATKVTTWLTVVCYAMIIVKLIALSYFTYGFFIQANIGEFLQTLFILDLILISALIILSLFFGVLKFSSFEENESKWDNRKW